MTTYSDKTNAAVADKIVKEFKYITVTEGHSNEHYQEYNVMNNKSGARIGVIEWHPPWNQFVFEPITRRRTIWSRGCLEDLQDAIDVVTERREQAKEQQKEVSGD